MGTPSGSPSQVQGAAPDWSKNLAATAVASFEDGNVMANTSDSTNVLLTLGLFQDANAIVIDPSKTEVRIEKRDSKKESKLPLRKSVEPLLMEQIKARSLHSGGEKSPPLVFDWSGQKLRAIMESSQGKLKYRIEFFDRAKKGECREKVQPPFRRWNRRRAACKSFEVLCPRSRLNVRQRVSRDKGYGNQGSGTQIHFEDLTKGRSHF
jgi:hypothetical protein